MNNSDTRADNKIPNLNEILHVSPMRHFVRFSQHYRTLLLISVCFGYSAVSSAETLIDAVNNAVATNPQVLGAMANTRAAKFNIKQAKAGYLPTVDIRAGRGTEHTNIKQLKRAGTALGTLGKREVALSLSQMLFDGFGTKSEVERRIELLNASENSTSDTREAIAFRAVEAYLDVLRNQHLVDLAVENVKAHEETLSDVKIKVRSGVGTSADQLQAEGRIALSRSILAARQGQLKESESNYQRVVGSMPSDLLVPAPRSLNLVEHGEIAQQKLNQAIDDAYQTASNEHPALKSANAFYSAADAAIDAAKAANFPRLDLEMNVTRDDNVSGVDGIRNTESLMLVARWNLFRGGADQAQIDALSEQHYASLQDVADTKRAIKENVEISLKAKATSELRLTYLAQHVSASAGTLESYKSQFGLGKRTLLDMLNAENELFTARSNEVVGKFDDILNQYFVEASKGILIKSLGVTP